MQRRNKEEEGGQKAQKPRRKRNWQPKVVLHVQPMDEQQARRLTTAVDALLAEWVRQEMGRERQP
jgi:hypothetical protein